MIARRLLDLGADINQTDNGDLTAVWIAVQGKQLEIVRLLIDRAARADIVPHDGVSLIDAANIVGDVEIALFLEDRLTAS